jgi:alkaline phosphatase
VSAHIARCPEIDPMKLTASLLFVCLAGGLVQVARAAAPDSFPAPDLSPAQLYEAGAADVRANEREPRHRSRAKNVILFVGDGMGISTVTAARILAGQLGGASGEENRLSFETMPYLAHSKTYSVNQQTSDSAPTITAMVTGAKTNEGVLSIDHLVPRGACDVSGHELKTIMEIAEQKGKSTGVVSTARITHATPAANYAHIADRDWESDANVSDACKSQTVDIAAQLLAFDVGDGPEVVLGGGRAAFLPSSVADPEGGTGARTDGRDLTQEWLARYGDGPGRGAYVWNKAGLDALPAGTAHLLGLFDASHMEFEHDRPADTGGEPSLSEMTATAIALLRKNRKGFYLEVESGRIDHAHHAGNAYRALTDAIEFAKAIEVAMNATEPKDTLIIVTADHSHTLTIAGYPKRGNNILGRVIEAGQPDGAYARAADDHPYTTLGYQNGRGFYNGVPAEAVYRLDPRSGRSQHFDTHPGDAVGLTATTDPDYHQEALVPTLGETHGGEDVAIYASGPQAHLFRGTMEQSSIFHVMLKAME